MLGKKPTTLERLKEATLEIKTLVEGGKIEYEGVPRGETPLRLR
jgi:hypothetical protein